MATLFTTADNNFGVAKWIVNATAGQGTHTTIASAITSASSGDVIFISPGTYTENPTLKAGVNLSSFPDGTTGDVIILGNCTLSGAGTVTISGIQLKTNSGNNLTVSGSAASIVNLVSCNINCSNNTGISYSSSSSSSAINLYQCTGDLGTTGIGYHSMSSTGNLRYYNCFLTNSGASTTASSNSAGAVLVNGSTFNGAFSTSSNGAIVSQYTAIDTSAINTASITHNGTNLATVIYHSILLSGTASTLSTGAGATTDITNSSVSSSNTNAITGSGTIVANAVTYTSTSLLNNTTTQSGGTIVGLRGGTAPSAGFIGEQIRSATTGVSLTSTNPANITSINLTAGIWDISCVGIIQDSSLSLTFGKIGISVNTGSFTGTTSGDSFTQLSSNAILANSIGLSIPAFRVTLSSTTTYYLVGQGNGIGTITADGRISGTRVG